MYELHKNGLSMSFIESPFGVAVIGVATTTVIN